MTRRGVLGSAVVLVWIGMLGWHAQREYLQPEATRLARATLTLDPATHFYTVRMGGQAVGIASSRLDTLPDGFLLEDRLSLELTALGQEGLASATTTVRLTPTLEMTSFAFRLSSEAGEFQASGEVEDGSVLRVTVEAGGEPQELTFRVGEAPMAAAALPIRIAKGGELREGRVIRFPVFDPTTVSTRTVEVEVMEQGTVLVADSAVRDPAGGRWVGAGSRQVPAWRLVERYGGISVESWIDEDGRILRSSTAMGLSLERAPFELIDQERSDSRGPGGEAGTGSDMILSTAIAADVDLGDPTSHDELHFVLSGVDLAGFHLDGGRQTLRGDTLVVRREAWSGLDPGYTLPYPRMDLADALRAEPLIQSGDPRIVEAARRAVGRSDRGGSATDPRAVARWLTDFVHQSLTKEMTFSLPSALQVLQTRRGDCNEHTVLFVAMARALGLPARTAVGLVYVDRAFFYHAWPEVWLGEWVAVDPTFGQAPAGAAHLRFMTGSLAQQVEIAGLIGNLRIQVVEPDAGAAGP